MQLTNEELKFLKECNYLYKKDGYQTPKGMSRLSRDYQDLLLNSAFDKLTNVLRNDQLNKQEATILLLEIHYVSEYYDIDDSGMDLIGLYNRLALLAGMDPLKRQ